MKKILLALALVFTLTASVIADMYPSIMIIVDIDKNADEVVCDDFVGNEWAFYGAEDYQIGDIISVIMDDNNSKTIYDDEIITTRYTGLVQIGK